MFKLYQDGQYTTVCLQQNLMMKLLIVLAFVAVVAARPDVDYNRYENFNVDEVIENRRLFKAYVECLQGVGKCTPEGNDLKSKSITFYFIM